MAGLLGEECRVFYDSVYSTRHAGRVSDLLAARLKNAGPDEVRLRALLLYAIYEGHRTMFESNPPKEADALAEGRLTEPLVIECGVDGEKVAVGVNFNYGETPAPDVNAIAKRVEAGTPQGAFEELLVGLYRSAHQLVLRVQHSAHRFEAIGVLAIPGKIDATEIARPRPIEAMEFLQDPVSPPKSAYVELGDLDYGKLLKDDSPGSQGKQAFRTGEALAAATEQPKAEPLKKIEGKELGDGGKTAVTGGEAKGDEGTKVAGISEVQASLNVAGTGEGAAATKVEGKSGDGDGKSEVKGQGDAKSDLTRVKGAAAELAANGVTVVKGSGESATSEELVRVSGSGTAQLKGVEGAVAVPASAAGEGQSAAPGVVPVSAATAAAALDDTALADKEMIAAYQSRIRQLEAQLVQAGQKAFPKAAESGGVAGLPAVTLADPAAEPTAAKPEEKGVIANLLSRFWPFNRKKDEAAATEAAPEVALEEGVTPPPGDGEEKKAEGVEPGSDAAKGDGSRASPAPQGAVNLEAAAKSLMSEIQGGNLDKTLNRAQKEAPEIKKRVKDEKAKQWVDGLMGDLLAEKGRIQEMAKKLNLSIRQKEIEFRNKEQALQEDLRRRDEQLRQKDYAILRSRDQVTQLATALDRAKKSAGASGEDAAYQQKFNHVSKLLAGTKDENFALGKKIEDLRKQLLVAKTVGKNQGPTFQDFNAVTERYEKAQKQAEEFKRQIQQLSDKLAESRARTGVGGGAGGEETKKRLEAAMKMLATGKKDQDKLATRVTEMQREEVKLRADVAKANAEVRRLRAQLGGAADGGKDKEGASPATTTPIAGAKKGPKSAA